MREPTLNAERIAALLDGRLSAEERAVVLEQLAADPEWREIAIDAAAVREAVHDANGNPAEPSLSVSDSVREGVDDQGEVRRVSRPAPTTKWAPWVALAAAACVTVFVLSRLDERSAMNTEVTPVAPVQALALSVSSDDARALTRERWRVVRAGANSVDEVARAVRLGALSVDALLDRAGRGAEAREEMIELLEPLNGAVARRLLVDARDSATSVAAFKAARGLVSSDAFDVGVWLELIRAGSDGAQMAPGMYDRLRRISEEKRLPPERAAELAALVRRLIDHNRSESRETLGELAAEVLFLLAS